MLTSVVILTHNKLPVTRRCMPTLLETQGAEWELIVVDNGSDDGTPEWLDGFAASAGARGVRMTIVRNAGNIGCSTARNQGATAASGDHLVFMDNDVSVRHRSWMRELARRFDDETVGVAGPKLVYPHPPHDIQCAGVGISQNGRVLFRGRGERRDLPEFNREQDMQTLISACFMVRRRAFDEAGGFDEAFNPVEFEDFDLCYRIRESGSRVVYVPSVEMYHLESVTTAGTASLPNTYLIIRHGLLFKRRWRHMFAAENGPDDSETPWRQVTLPAFEELGEPPLLD
jgi:GT2 family glycosyltransferase